MSTMDETYAGITERGPMEQWVYDLLYSTDMTPIEQSLTFAREQDARYAALMAALERYGQHEKRNGKPACERLWYGLVHTVEADCTCGLYAALALACEVTS